MALRYCSSLITLGVTLLASPLCADHTWTLEDLLAGHRSHLDAIERVSLRLEITIEHFVRGERIPTTGNPNPSWIWARSHELERLRYRESLPSGDPERKDETYDWFVSPTETRLLMNAIPGASRLEPGEHDHVVASIMPRMETAPGRDASRMLLWTFAASPSDPRRTLEQLCRTSADVRMIGPGKIRAVSGWLIRVAHPEAQTKYPGNYHEVLIDPARRFSVVAVVEHLGRFQKRIGRELEDYELTVTRVVDRFTERGDGLLIPAELTLWEETTLTDQRYAINRLTVHDLKVNDEVPDEEFDFRFPENAVVTVDPPLHPDRRTAYLWGKDNQPAREIQSVRDLPMAPNPDPISAGSANGTTSGSWLLSGKGWLLLGNGLAVLLTLVAYRGLRRRR
jgi:hypothetical protein